MAKDKKPGKPYRLEERDGRQVRVYESGAVLDHTTGSIVKPPAQVLITEQNTYALHRARQEQKQAAVAEAASGITKLEAARNPDMLRLIGTDDWAFIRAIAIGRQRAAMDSDNPYGNAAANWIMQHTGNDKQQAEQADDDDRTILHALAERIRQLGDDNGYYREHGAVDAQVLQKSDTQP